MITPTTDIQGREVDADPIRIRLPIGSRPGQYVRANVSFTSATGAPDSESAAVKERPLTSVSRSASTAPSETTCQSPRALVPGGGT